MLPSNKKEEATDICVSWIDLMGISLSEKRLSQKIIYCMSLFI